MKKFLFIAIASISLGLMFLMNNCAQSNDANYSSVAKPIDRGPFVYQVDAPPCKDISNSNISNSKARVEITAETTCNCNSSDYPNLPKKLVNGFSTYFVESDVCAAAKHMGLLGLETSTVVIKPGNQCHEFLGLVSNGITSVPRTLTGNDNTFYFKDHGDGACSQAPNPGPGIDITRPTLETKIPANGSTNVPLNTSLILTFSEQIQKGTGKVKIFKTTGDVSVEEIEVTSASVEVFTAFNTQVVIIPTTNLEANTDYYVQIDATAFSDIAGNFFQGITNKTDYNFKTAAIATDPAPNLALKLPLDNATDVEIDSNIVLIFSENIIVGTGQITIYKSDDSVFEDIDVKDTKKVSVSATDKRVVTINPATNFTNDKDYYIKIAKTAFKDSKQQNYAGIVTKTDYNFKTVQSSTVPILSSTSPSDNATVPILSLTSPSDNATDVAIDSNIVLTFSETMKIGTGNVTLFKSDGDNKIQDIAVTSAMVVVTPTNHKIITINPSSNLANNTDYYIKIDASAFVGEKTGGKNFAGIGTSTVLNFKTKVDSDPSPTLMAKLPADGAMAVPLVSDFVLTFSEDINKGTSGNISIYKTEGDVLVEKIEVTGIGVKVDGVDKKKVIVHPSKKFLFSTDYYIKIDANAFKDSAGQFYAGINNNSDYNFKTISDTDPSPILTSTNPADNSQNVARNFNIILNFSEKILKGSGNITIFKSMGDIKVEEIAVTSTRVVIDTVDNKKVTIDPSSNLSFDTEYYIKIDTMAFKDSANQNYAGISNSTDYNFKTIKEANPAPTLLSMNPADNSLTVPTNSDLVLTFSKPIFKGTGNVSLYTTVGDVLVENMPVTGGRVTVSTLNPSVVTINPTKDFVNSTDYYIKIEETSFKDASGKTFAGISNSLAYNFKTVADSDLSPKLITKSPAVNSMSVAVDSNIVLTFSENIKIGTGKITIYKTAGAIAVEAIDVTGSMVVVDKINPKMVTINPSKNLAFATDYYVMIDKTAFKDFANLNFPGINNSTDYNFKTVDDTDLSPTLKSTLPLDNAPSVAIDSNIVLTFSENITVGTGNITIYRGSDDGKVEEIAVKSTKVVVDSADHKKVTINPVNNLKPGVDYYIKIDGAAFKDSVNQNFIGINNSTDYNFKTAPKM